MIKAQYLGGEKKKKKVLKGAEKFKFNFDWEAGDDTSRDLNPLYNQTHGAPTVLQGCEAAVPHRIKEGRGLETQNLTSSITLSSASLLLPCGLRASVDL